MGATTFEELLSRCTRTALKLELRDVYMTDDPGYLAWLSGDVDGAVASYANWTRTARAAVSRGVSMRRVRVISMPVTHYISFEHAITNQVNIAAGEVVRWLPRQFASSICLPGNDVWIFDDLVAQFYHFSGDGAYLGDEVTDTAEVVHQCADAFLTAWEHGIDHYEFNVR
ncbi:MAG TPA: hypothetical protein VFC19_17975 [Candidatus Limnocylindrales bacterium]|nr:hypothetical protein [Candidatus Limnocylindrales bacterium]